MPGIFFPSPKPRFIDREKVIAALKEIALRAARKNKNIKAVYLFGSYACGNAGLYSDADILIVLSQDKRDMMSRLDEFILEFSDGPVPVDVLVYTSAEIEAALKKGNRFLANALTGIRF